MPEKLDESSTVPNGLWHSEITSATANLVSLSSSESSPSL